MKTLIPYMLTFTVKNLLWFVLTAPVRLILCIAGALLGLAALSVGGFAVGLFLIVAMLRRD